MSAYLVGPDVITGLVAAAIQLGRRDGFRWFIPGETSGGNLWGLNVDGDRSPGCATRTPTELGRVLWGENLRSIEARYPSEAESAEPFGTPREEVTGWTYEAPTTPGLYVLGGGGMTATTHDFDPVAVLASLAGFEYQTCESDDWYWTEAYWVCNALRLAAIHKLPGYGEAGWGAALCS